MNKFIAILCFGFVGCANTEVIPPTDKIVDPVDLNLDPQSACCTCGEGLLEDVPAKPGCGYPCCYAA
jgi:hypothetical protein